MGKVDSDSDLSDSVGHKTTRRASSTPPPADKEPAALANAKPSPVAVYQGARVKVVLPETVGCQEIAGRNGIALRRDNQDVQVGEEALRSWVVKLDGDRDLVPIPEEYLQVIPNLAGRRRLTAEEILRLRRRRPTSAEVVLGRLLEEIKSL